MTSKKIDHLTKEQEAAIPKYVEKWLKIGTDTNPANRELAEEGIKQAYKDAGLKLPGMVWFKSQSAMVVCRSLAQMFNDQRDDLISTQLAKELKKVKFTGGLDLSNPKVTNKIGLETVKLGIPLVGKAVQGVMDSAIEGLPTVLSIVELTKPLMNNLMEEGKGDLKLFAKAFHTVLVKHIKNNLDKIRTMANSAISECGYGQHDASWLAFYDFFASECGLVEETKPLRGLWQAAQNMGWFAPHEDICFMAERHTFISRDEQNNLHNEVRSCIEYPDGLNIYAWHGIQVDKYIIEDPMSITVDDIEKESNAEIRRIKITQYDRARQPGAFIKDSGAKMIDKHEDPHVGILWRKDLRGDEDMVFVEAKNSTPEPDGSYKWYMYRVHPELRPIKNGRVVGGPQKMTVWNAKASSFGMTGEEFSPEFES